MGQTSSAIKSLTDDRTVALFPSEQLEGAQRQRPRHLRQPHAVTDALLPREVAVTSLADGYPADAGQTERHRPLSTRIRVSAPRTETAGETRLAIDSGYAGLSNRMCTARSRCGALVADLVTLAGSQVSERTPKRRDAQRMERRIGPHFERRQRRVRAGARTLSLTRANVSETLPNVRLESESRYRRTLRRRSVPSAIHRLASMGRPVVTDRDSRLSRSRVARHYVDGVVTASDRRRGPRSRLSEPSAVARGEPRARRFRSLPRRHGSMLIVVTADKHRRYRADRTYDLGESEFCSDRPAR